MGGWEKESFSPGLLLISEDIKIRGKLQLG